MKFFYTTFFAFLITFSANADSSNWLTSLDQAKKIALGSNKLILVDFWATWCGPCKRMDAESWSKKEVQILMNDYVSVKIDIDRNRSLAQKYGVQGIPYIFIMDGNGKVVYQQMSYKRKSEVIKLLKKYAINTSYLSADMINYYKKQNFITAFRLGIKYQDYSLHLGDSLRNDIIDVSTKYLDEARNYLKETEIKNKTLLKQKLDLFTIQEYLILNRPEKALKKLNKLHDNDLQEGNKKFYAFLKYVAYLQKNDEEMITKTKDEISETDLKKAELFIATI